MSFLSARKAKDTAAYRLRGDTFRPRLEALEHRCLLSAGALDATFGTNGLVTNPSGFTSGSVVAYANTGNNPATDGKIVVNRFVNSGTSNFSLVRYYMNGTLDTTFGSGGIVNTPVGVSGQSSFISGLALQSDGKIVAVGEAVCALVTHLPDDSFAVARYNPNGSLDPSFGNGGIVLTNVEPIIKNVGSTGFDEALAVAIQADGKIDVTGYANTVTGSLSQRHMALVRYNANGTLDTTFGNKGIVVTQSFGTGDVDNSFALAIYPNTGTPNDGKIVLAGDNVNSQTGQTTGIAVARYTKDGVLDTSFNAGGSIPGIVFGILPSSGAAQATGAAANGVLIQSNGAIVVGGWSAFSTGAEGTLVRLNANGGLDPTFGTLHTGTVINSGIVNAYAITQVANGDVLLAGNAGIPGNTATYDLAVAAYLPDGSPDTTFGSTAPGITTVGFSNGSMDRALGMASQSDGKILAVGFSYPSGGSGTIALARFLAPSNTFTVSPNPVKAGNSITLYASNIMDTKLTGPIQQVAFYRDTNGNGILEVGTDTFLGYGTSDSNGTWSFTSLNSFGLISGTYTLFAQASDGVNVSIPLVVTLQVT
jgi:uncharacterized delta-60 repeat protein